MGELSKAGYYTRPEFFLHSEYSSADKQSKTEKSDKVRLYWEDEIVRFSLRPFLRELVFRKLQNHKKLRILDLACGKGHGYEIITQITGNSSDLKLNKAYILPEEMIELYMGLDLKYEAVEQANEYYKHKKKVRFIKTNFRTGLGAFKEYEAPFDLYFSSYGALSQLKAEELKILIKDICLHAHKGSLLVLDLAGQDSLNNHFGLTASETTFWSYDALKNLLKEIYTSAGIGFELLKKTDRSLLIANSPENRQYSQVLRHIREAVNSLFENFVRTDLRKLILKPEFFPESEKSQVNQVFQELMQNWNLFIRYVIKRFENEINPKELEGWNEFHPALSFGILTLDRLIKDTEWISYGDTRANIIEPHIAYVLRSFEYELQKGLGCGQNLSLVLRISK